MCQHVSDQSEKTAASHVSVFYQLLFKTSEKSRNPTVTYEVELRPHQSLISPCGSLSHWWCKMTSSKLSNELNYPSVHMTTCLQLLVHLEKKKVSMNTNKNWKATTHHTFPWITPAELSYRCDRKLNQTATCFSRTVKTGFSNVKQNCLDRYFWKSEKAFRSFQKYFPSLEWKRHRPAPVQISHRRKISEKHRIGSRFGVKV